MRLFEMENRNLWSNISSWVAGLPGQWLECVCITNVTDPFLQRLWLHYQRSNMVTNLPWATLQTVQWTSFYHFFGSFPRVLHEFILFRPLACANFLGLFCNIENGNYIYKTKFCKTDFVFGVSAVFNTQSHKGRRGAKRCQEWCETERRLSLTWPPGPNCDPPPHPSLPRLNFLVASPVGHNDPSQIMAPVPILYPAPLLTTAFPVHDPFLRRS